MTLSFQTVPSFTVTPIDLESPELLNLIGDQADITFFAPETRPLSEVIRPSVGCISEDENRERLGQALALDLPSVATLKGKYAGQKLIICGGGASLEQTLLDIRRARRRSKRVKILAVNKTHDWLIEKGIIPDFGVLMDPRAHLVDYMTPHRGVTYLFGASVDKRIFERFSGRNVYLWYPIGTARDEPYVRDLLRRRYPWKSVAMIPGPSTVGLRSVHLGMDILGFTSIELHGFDSCYDPKSGTLWPYRKDVTFEPMKIDFSVVSKTDGTQFKCVSNPDMARQVYEFDKMIELLIASVKNGRRRYLPNITVAGDGAIPWMAWKNNGHATPGRMMEKYGYAAIFDYARGAESAFAKECGLLSHQLLSEDVDHE